MPDKKLTDNEIIKALEYCVAHEDTCEDCPCVINQTKCATNDPKIAFDLINRLQAENERLKNNSSCYGCRIKHRKIEASNNIISMLKAENKSLRATIDSFTDIGKLYSEIKAEAYKECIEKVKVIVKEEIDNFLKELEGDDNG